MNGIQLGCYERCNNKHSRYRWISDFLDVTKKLEPSRNIPVAGDRLLMLDKMELYGIRQDVGSITAYVE